MLVFRGQVPDGVELDLPTLRGSFSFPIKYGYASVGRVVEIGPDVGCLAPGDVVFVHHPHQTEYVVGASLPIKLPDTLDPRDSLQVGLRDVHLRVIRHRLNGRYETAGDRPPGLYRRAGDIAHVQHRRVLGLRIFRDGLAPATDGSAGLTAGVCRQRRDGELVLDG